METASLIQTLTLLKLFGWLFLILPIVDSVNSYFFQQAGFHDLRLINPLGWYAEFIKVLKQEGAHNPPFAVQLSRKFSILVLLSAAIMALSVLPISGGVNLEDSIVFLDNGSTLYDLFFVLGLLFIMGLIHVSLGFSFNLPLLRSATLDRVFVRQSTILILALAVFSAPHVMTAGTILEILSGQQITFFNDTYYLGVLLNPIAFVCACIALAIHFRGNYSQYTAQPSILNRTIQSELVATDLLTFRICLGIEAILLNAILVIVFLGGPYFQTESTSIWTTTAIFTAKLIFVQLLIAFFHHILPMFSNRQAIRILYLILLPFILLSFFAAIWVKDLLTYV